MPPKRKASVKTKQQPASKKQKTTKSETKATPKSKKTSPAAEKSSSAAVTGAGDATGGLIEQLTDKGWKDALKAEFDQPYFKELEKTLDGEYKQKKEIFPPRHLIFNAFNLTPIDKVKVVILGQDPYHDNGQAMGLSFSVLKDKAVPPSLKNIYKELERDPKIAAFTAPTHGCLQKWAENGILLLNATLTVEAHKANSHAKFGWQKFTDNVIKCISDQCDHVAFVLWGGFAQKKEKLIDAKKHRVIKTAHPSPLSANKFKACNCFSDCNDALIALGQGAMDWSLD